jgi:signal transduction histidine kinase
LEQIESGFGVSMTDFDIGDLINEARDDMKPLLTEKNLPVVIDVQDPIPLLHADRRWVKRAFLNYLDNAAKYTESGGTITIKAFTNDKMLHVEVVDNGPGIPVEAQKRLFERFYRAADDKIKGTGLGLAIVKSVAEKHGGGVYVRSQKDQGSTFGMTFSLNNVPIPE